jgi:hypothetical protein
VDHGCSLDAEEKNLCPAEHFLFWFSMVFKTYSLLKDLCYSLLGKSEVPLMDTGYVSAGTCINGIKYKYEQRLKIAENRRMRPNIYR